MPKEVFLISTYNPCTRQLERVSVTRDVYKALKQTSWNIKDNNESFYKHEIQMSSLPASENDSCEYYEEFKSAPDEVDRFVMNKMLNEALYDALNQLNDRDYDLIYALYFEGKSLSKYANEIGSSTTALFVKRNRILRDLKKFLTFFQND